MKTSLIVFIKKQITLNSVKLGAAKKKQSRLLHLVYL